MENTYIFEKSVKKTKSIGLFPISYYYSSSLRTATVLPHQTNVHIQTRLMSLLFVWKDRVPGRQTCRYPLAQPTEEAKTVDNAGPQFGGEVWATGKLTFKMFAFLEGKTRALLQNTCSPAI